MGFKQCGCPSHRGDGCFNRDCRCPQHYGVGCSGFYDDEKPGPVREAIAKHETAP